MKRTWILFPFFLLISLGLFLCGMYAINIANQEAVENNTDLPQPLRGRVTQVETGKDGLQVLLQTDYLLYNVTISRTQTEIIGSFDQIILGAEIEVSGRSIAEMDPPLIAAEHVKILNGRDPLKDEIWTLVFYNGQQPLPGQQATIIFEEGQISGTTGCNRFVGSYQINADEIEIAGIYHTEMACPEPDGIMGQEVIYLDLLRLADRYLLYESRLTLFSGADPILIFENQTAVPGDIETTQEPQDPDSARVSTNSEVPEFVVPDGYQEYQDLEAGVLLYIPESWNVSGIMGGEYAIFQSYPLDKYTGGEKREEGDTKCDLNIQPPGALLPDLINQWESDGFTTILAEDEFEFAQGVSGKRLVIASLGESVTFSVEISSRLVLLTCFGDYSEIDTIAATMQESK